MSKQTSSALPIMLMITGLVSIGASVLLIIRGYPPSYYLVSLIFGPLLVWTGYNNYQKFKQEQDESAKP